MHTFSVYQNSRAIAIRSQQHSFMVYLVFIVAGALLDCFEQLNVNGSASVFLFRQEIATLFALMHDLAQRVWASKMWHRQVAWGVRYL